MDLLLVHEEVSEGTSGLVSKRRVIEEEVNRVIQRVRLRLRWRTKPWARELTEVLD